MDAFEAAKFRRLGPRRRLGFSFLELLVAVTIIGVIAAILVPRVSVSTAASKDRVQAHHIAHLNNLVEVYHNQTGSWPTALTDLVPSYLPDGVPAPPHGGAYSIDSGSHRVSHSP